jgi:adenosylcobinamide-GDP ribazoletransferase
MKDSRLGTYGVIGLIASLSMKFLLLHELVHIVSLYLLPFILIAAHSISRGMAIVIMQTLTYVQDIDSSKSKPLANRQLTLSELVIASVGMILPLLILIEKSNLQFELAISVIPVLIGALFLGRYWKKWIGGYTGDCLGATQQITELIFYFTVVLIWKFI